MMRTNVRKGFLWLAGVAALGVIPLRGADSPKGSLVTVELQTGETKRPIVIELDEARAPQTCANFRKNLEAGFYDGLAVHRIIPNYLVQMGDPYTREPGKKHLWGTGGPDYTVPAELGGKHVRGSVAMARLPDAQNPRKESNGSQFYVALDDLNQLDGDYTVFGKVVRGIEHLDYVSLLTADTNDVPLTRVAIARAGVGEALRSSPSLGERAVKPVAVAAEGLKGVGKAVTSLPILGGKDEDKAAKEDAPASPAGAPAAAAPVPAPAAPAPSAGPGPAPQVAAHASAVPAMPAATPPDAGSAPEGAAEGEGSHPKWPLLSKLAPSKLLVLGRKKEAEAEPAALETGAVPGGGMPASAAEEGKKRFLSFGHKDEKETPPGTPAAVGSTPAAVEIAKPGAEVKSPAPAPVSEEGKKRFLSFGHKDEKETPPGTPAAVGSTPAAAEVAKPAAPVKKASPQPAAEEKPRKEAKEEKRKGFIRRMLNKDE